MNKVSKELWYLSIKFKSTPDRRRNKIGFVERGNDIGLILVQKICTDAQHDINTQRKVVERSESLSRSTYLSNIIFGRKILSIFEMVRGYSPSISGLSQRKLTDEIVTAHQEQVSRRALKLLSNSHPPKIPGPKEFKKKKGYTYSIVGRSLEHGGLKKSDPRKITSFSFLHQLIK